MSAEQITQLQRESAELRAAIDAARRNSAELEQSLSELAPLTAEQQASANELKGLYALVTKLESQRDRAMNECNELIATIRKRNDRIKRLEASTGR